MITLITGAPGAGKSAALVDLLSTISKNRIIYADGIPDLKIEHQPLDEPSRWHETVPDGSAIVIDEVQRVWRPRGPGQKVPADIAALETHRHRGLDFFIVTQSPRLVDGNVRALVGRHVHLRDVGLLGRWWYEWPECSEQISWKSAPIKKKYKLPAKAFELYKSASLHIKPIRSVPRVLIVLIVALIVTAVLGFYAFRAVNARIHPKQQKDDPATINTSEALPAIKTTGLEKEITAEDMIVSFIPRIPGEPGSAPAYDHLRKVINLPRVVGGICIDGQCSCMTEQGTDAGMTQQQCNDWHKSTHYNPYYRRPDPDQRQATVQDSQVQPPAQGA